MAPAMGDAQLNTRASVRTLAESASPISISARLFVGIAVLARLAIQSAALSQAPVTERLVALPPEKPGERPMTNLLPFFQVQRSITMQPERWAKRLIVRAIPFMTLGNPI
jgi:hypothetical protein